MMYEGFVGGDLGGWIIRSKTTTLSYFLFQELNKVGLLETHHRVRVLTCKSAMIYHGKIPVL